MSATVVVGRVKHETNTFSTLSTGDDEFAATSLFAGEEIPSEFRETNTDLGGFLRVADEDGTSSRRSPRTRRPAASSPQTRSTGSSTDSSRVSRRPTQTPCCSASTARW